MLEVTRLEGEVVVDDQHQYWVDNNGPYKSVTKLIGTGRGWYKPEHAARGTRAHQACEMYDRTGECFTDVDEGGYLEAWQGFLSDMGERIHIIDIEVKFVALVNGRFIYGGTVDRLCRIDGELAVLDIKSGGRNAWHQTQLAAYGAPFGAMTGYAVYIAKTGRYKVEVFNYLPDAFCEWAMGVIC